MTTDAVGGVWTYAADLAAGLQATGVTVKLAVLGPPPERLPPGAVAIDAPLDWTAERPAEVLAAGEAVAAVAESVGADLVHLNSPALAAGGAFRTPVLGVCHSDVATWWAAVKGGPPPDDLAWRADLTGRGYARCDALIAPSASFGRATAATFGIGPAVVHNGRHGRGPRASRAHLALEGGEPAERAGHARSRGGVFTCGRLWDEGKGVAVLDRAAAGLSAPVLAAGPLTGPNGAVARLSNAWALGPLSAEAVRERLTACAVFCSPALYEPFGLAVLEAAQAGAPLALADIPTFRELWDGAAVFTPPGDHRALAAALEVLLADEDARDRWGAAARDRSRRYTVEAMTAGVLAAYRRLLPARAAA